MDVRSNTERVLNFKLTSVMNLQAVFVPTVLLTKLGLCHNFNHVFETLSGRKVTYVMPRQTSVVEIRRQIPLEPPQRSGFISSGQEAPFPLHDYLFHTKIQ